MFKNLSIKKKLLLLVGFPLTVLILLSAYVVYKKYNDVSTLHKLNKVFEFARYDISNLLLNIQRERGYSSAYISSGGKKFKAELQNQRVLTDKAIVKFKKELQKNNLQKIDKRLYKIILSVLNKLQNINDIREKVDSLKISLIDEIKYYSSIDSDLLRTKYEVLKYPMSEKNVSGYI